MQHTVRHRFKNFLERQSYWMSAVGFIGTLAGIAGFIWSVLHTPDPGQLNLSIQHRSNDEVVIIAKNTGGQTAILTRIELQFSKPITMDRIINDDAEPSGLKLEQLEFREVVRAAYSNRGVPYPNDKGVMYTRDSTIGPAQSPLSNSCDAMSGQLPCEIPPYAEMVIRILMKTPIQKTLSSFGLAYSHFDIMESLGATGSMNLCAIYDNNRQACLENIESQNS